MKLLRTILLFTTLLIFTNCTDEYYSMCPPLHNVSLYFSLPNKQGEEIFSDQISSVDVYVYDDTGTFMLLQRVNKSDLNEFQGTHLLLEPGSYDAICWANMNELTHAVGVENATNPAVTYQEVIGNQVQQADSLYTAKEIIPRIAAETRASSSYRITVPEEGNYEGTALFTAAHRQIEVYIEGYTNNGVPALPEVELTGLPKALSLLNMAPSKGATVNFKQLTQETTILDKIYAGAKFHTLWFDLDNSIHINIFNPSTGELIFEVPLIDAIEASTDPNELIIRVVFEFINGEVEITFPGWDSGDIGWD